MKKGQNKKKEKFFQTLKNSCSHSLLDLIKPQRVSESRNFLMFEKTFLFFYFDPFSFF